MKNYQIDAPKAIVGMDISGEAIQKAQASFPEFRYIKGDIMNLMIAKLELQLTINYSTNLY